MKKILIIYNRAGGGHLSLALALEEALRQFSIFNFQFSIKLVDPFPNLYATGYKTLNANFQNFYGLNWHLTDNHKLARAIHTLNYVAIGNRLTELFKREEPDLVVSTHALATAEVFWALKRVGLVSKIAIVFADPFSLHQTCFTFKDADLYLSPTREATQQALKAGIRESRIVTTGWLVRNEFRNQKSEIRDLRRKLGLDENKFTIFLGGSGQGGGQVLKLAKLLISQLSIINCQLLIVAGMNRRLENQSKSMSDKTPATIKAFGYVENMAELISASDVVVGKAGPNLLFESIFCERPFLATGTLPGQEEGNLEFIKRENLGWVKENPQKAVSLLSYLSDLSNLRASLAEKLPNLQRVKAQNLNAPKKAASAILALLKP